MVCYRGLIQITQRSEKNYDEIPMTYVKMIRRVVEKFRGYSMDIPASVARTSCSISLECVC